MADALISPAVGGVMWAASVGVIAYSVYKVNKEDVFEDKKIPLMGVAGAFVFAAQMINFAIPGTGATGHISGGLMLAAMLGPHAGFLVMSVVLAIQAFFFADGGLLALGCNIFNLGFFTCYVAYPLIFRPIFQDGSSRKRVFIASVAAAACGLLLGAFSVVLETTVSGVTALPFGGFALLMLPIHLAIGVVEGVVTATVLLFIHANARDLMPGAAPAAASRRKRVVVALVCAALLLGGAVSLLASENPDGLEWAIFHASGEEELESSGAAAFETAESIQESTAVMPDYSIPDSAVSETAGTSVAGIVGSLIVLGFVVIVAAVLYIPKKLGRRAQS